MGRGSKIPKKITDIIYGRTLTLDVSWLVGTRADAESALDIALTATFAAANIVKATRVFATVICAIHRLICLYRARLKGIGQVW